MDSKKHYYIYRFYYDDCIVYVGRTKQPLQNRVRGHLFSKPMHRTLHIDLVTKIEFSELPTEADMNLYELYYILKDRPALNVDDKAHDQLTVTLPELRWTKFTTPLWEKWVAEIHSKDSEYEVNLRRYRCIPEEKIVVKSLLRTGQISEEDCYKRLDDLNEEFEQLRKVMWH